MSVFNKVKNFIANQKLNKEDVLLENIEEPIIENGKIDTIVENISNEDVLIEENSNVEEQAKAILDEMSRKILLDMPVWMKCNYLMNQIARIPKELQENINWDKVNEILLNTNLPMDFNIFDRVSSIEELDNVRGDAILASTPEFHMSYLRKTCKKCKNTFTLTLSEINWYEKKGLHIPSRCQYCRKGEERPKPIAKIEPKEEPMKTSMELAMEKAGIL